MVGLSLCKPYVDFQNSIVLQEHFEKNSAFPLRSAAKEKLTETRVHTHNKPKSLPYDIMTFAVHDSFG